MSNENPLRDHLDAALEADDPDERDYHVRQAAQLFGAKQQADTNGGAES